VVVLLHVFPIYVCFCSSRRRCVGFTSFRFAAVAVLAAGQVIAEGPPSVLETDVAERDVYTGAA
jgi:hypothetical protein